MDRGAVVDRRDEDDHADGKRQDCLGATVKAEAAVKKRPSGRAVVSFMMMALVWEEKESGEASRQRGVVIPSGGGPKQLGV